jgi:hypothetical protein
MENTNELSLLAKKLNEHLNGRAKPVAEAIAKIERTGTLLDDYIAPVTSLEFIRDTDRVNLNLRGIANVNYDAFRLHDHAQGQIADKLGVPPSYLKSLIGGKDWQKNLSVDIMNTHSANITRERVLVRTVEGEVRGFLSDKYRRLNSMEIFVAFLLAAQQNGNVLVDAHSGETKGFLEVINPNIIEFDTPLNGRNFAAIGARIRNSDFGDGALEVYQFLLMVRCMNGLVGESRLKEFHLGGRIPDNISISEDTYRKDTAAKAALVGDIMKSLYTGDNTTAMIERIKGASAKEVDIVKEVERLPKLGLTMTESDAVGKVLMENNPDNGLQGSATLWKLVNGLTAVARDAAPERKRELELIAGNMLVK